MSKYYETDEFLKLNKTWQEKLAKNGFNDIENENGKLKDHDRRTISFENQEEIIVFIDKLQNYINTNKLPPKHKKIISLYCAGIHIKGDNSITSKLGYSPSSEKYIRLIIKKYKDIILKG